MGYSVDTIILFGARIDSDQLEKFESEPSVGLFVGSIGDACGGTSHHYLCAFHEVLSLEDGGLSVVRMDELPKIDDNSLLKLQEKLVELGISEEPQWYFGLFGG